MNKCYRDCKDAMWSVLGTIAFVVAAFCLVVGSYVATYHAGKSDGCFNAKMQTTVYGNTKWVNMRECEKD